MENPKTNITAKHKTEFDALISGEFGNFALVSCFLEGKPTAVIAYVNTTEDGGLTVTPVWVAVEDSMQLTAHDGQELSNL